MQATYKLQICHHIPVDVSTITDSFWRLLKWVMVILYLFCLLSVTVCLPVAIGSKNDVLEQNKNIRFQIAYFFHQTAVFRVHINMTFDLDCQKSVQAKICVLTSLRWDIRVLLVPHVLKWRSSRTAAAQNWAVCCCQTVFILLPTQAIMWTDLIRQWATQMPETSQCCCSVTLDICLGGEY